MKKFKNYLIDLAHLKSAIAVLAWDQEVHMPKGGSAKRAATMSHLVGLLHEQFLAPAFATMLKDLKGELDAGRLDSGDAAVVREVWREFEREQKLPVEFVKELTQTCSEANVAWVEARKKSDFSIFAPYLEKIVALKREEAKLVGYKDSPYDALLDIYEPELTTRAVTVMLGELKSFLAPFVKKIQQSPTNTNPKIIQGNFPIDQQLAFNKKVVEQMGYDFDRGRVDVSAHPFTIHFHPDDVRITTRFSEHDIWPALGSSIHEAGHALYEQGIPAENFGTPLGESVSLGIHESQSRVWENMVGKGRAFWQYWYPELRRVFPKPFATISLADFYRAINHVEPSLIRTESDEVTYNLHIILRFELEKDLIEGKITVHDLPKLWNEKMKEYFGLDVPGDAQGVLQDVHWSHGSFGYFPTYTLGNLYSAQFYAAAKKSIPDLETQFAVGNFKPFREWLRKHIHIHGKYYTAEMLVRHTTGEMLTSAYFIDYLSNKFNDLYNNITSTL